MSLVSVLRHSHEAMRLGTDQAMVDRILLEFLFFARISLFMPNSSHWYRWRVVFARLAVS